ncbi:MAG: lysophospholipid acyltransferase family protein [Cytophagaceae bacterium]|nr:lysophospholipid acyltransferase family protein [Cytophagaceae bacterium]MDW8456490.1 lysophospholipid acyltransferase family protein [Cytophagaceae bacterium]
MFKVISWLPLSVLYRFSFLIYVLTYKIFRYRINVVKENIQNCFSTMSRKEQRRIISSFYRNLSDVVVEILKAPSIKKEELEKRVKMKNMELPLSYHEKGIPVICLTGHLCNWEWLLMACSLHTPYSIDAVYKPMHIAWMEKLFRYTRSRFGARLLPMRDVLKAVIRNKAEIKAIAMVADQIPPEAEIQYFTNFLNQNTAFFVGGDKLAKYMNAPVLFVDMKRIKKGYYEIEFISLTENAEQDLPSFPITESYARQLEKRILASPQDWLWTHRRWKHKTWKWEKQTVPR